MIRQLYLAQEGRCFFCEEPLGIKKITKDHLLPKSRTNVWRSLRFNLVLAHKKCNCNKGNRLPTSFEISKMKEVYKRVAHYG